MIKKNLYTNSILNVVSSISTHFWMSSNYSPNEDLLARISWYKNIIFMIIDGLWYNYLINNCQNSILNKFCIQKINTVFPTSTAPVLASIITWKSPIEHWYIWSSLFFREYWILFNPLSSKFFLPWLNLSNYQNINKNLLLEQSRMKSLDSDLYVVNKSILINSDYSINSISHKTIKLWYDTIWWFFIQIWKALKYNDNKKLVYAYRPNLDYLSHIYWHNSKEHRNDLENLDYKISNFVHNMSEDTALIITSDHWTIENSENDVIDFDKFPQIHEYLFFPPVWDSRIKYFYVKNKFNDKFIEFISRHLAHKVDLYSTNEFVKLWLLWDKKLLNNEVLNRMWDYVVIAKDKNILLAWWQKFYKWNHWGLTDDELFIPLIFIWWRDC